MSWLQGPRAFLVPAAFIVSLLLPVYFALAALGTRFGLWDYTVGLVTLTITVGPLLLIGAAVLAVLALLAAFLSKPAGGRRAALVALLIPVAALVYAGQLRATAMSVPPIHDISTDLTERPDFSPAVIAARGAKANKVVEADFVFADDAPAPLRGRPLAEIQETAYPDIVTIRADASTERAFNAAHAAAQRIGLELGLVDPAAGIIEATAKSFWFGFVDDVVIRVRPDGVGAAIDVRSVSRVGISDLGANANRIRAFRKAFFEIV